MHELEVLEQSNVTDEGRLVVGLEDRLCRILKMRGGLRRKPYPGGGVDESFRHCR
jgi:hypothetical protein